jgi:mannan polymerase II complex MNN10 subunit
MLLRSLKLPPSLLLLIVCLAFFGWQLSKGTLSENGSLDTQFIQQNEGGNRAPRIALMTFVTDQRSYLHLSLKNKDRKLAASSQRNQT